MTWLTHHRFAFGAVHVDVTDEVGVDLVALPGGGLNPMWRWVVGWSEFFDGSDWLRRLVVRCCCAPGWFHPCFG